MRITSYLDDILICSRSFQEACIHRDKTLSVLSSLGFQINWDKSLLIPSQNILHLGYLWDSKSMSISLPVDKLSKIKSLCRYCLNNPCNLRSLASLLGLLVSSSKGFKFAALFFRKFQLNFIQGLKTKSGWDSYWNLDNDSRLDLSWWCSANIESLSPVSFSSHVAEFSIFTDASLLGWGASLSSGEFASGCWSDDDSKEHINFLELKAIHLTLVHFMPILKGKSISIHCDNSTTVYYFNKIGGTHSRKLCLLSLEIWHLIRANELICKAHFISGMNNKSADYLSRFSDLHEYYLSPDCFNLLMKIIPFELKIDMFASHKNKKLMNYVSIFHDETSLFFDAFSRSWCSNIYIFPPLPMIGKALMKVFRDQIEFCLFITPAWISLSFIPLIKDALIFNPIFIHSHNLLGRTPSRHPFHLMAWPISSPYARRKGIHPRFQPYYSRVLPPQPSKPIVGSGLDLWNGLMREDLNPIFLP